MVVGGQDERFHEGFLGPEMAGFRFAFGDLEYEGMFAGLFFGQLDDEALAGLGPIELAGMAEQGDARDSAGRRRQRADDEFAALRPSQREGINDAFRPWR